MKALVELINLRGDLLAEEVLEVDDSHGLAQGILDLCRSSRRFSDQVDPDHAHEARERIGHTRLVELEQFGDALAFVQVTTVCRWCVRDIRGGDVCWSCSLPSAEVAHG